VRPIGQCIDGEMGNARHGFDVMRRALDPAFEAVFGDRRIRQQWFQQMLQSALVASVTDACRDFTQLGRAALEMTAQRHGLERG
jgi:hypothetical protein